MRNTYKILPLLLAVIMLAGLIPAAAQAASTIGLPGDLSGLVAHSGSASTYQHIYFGNYNGSPIKWRILDKSNGELFLLSEGFVSNNMAFDSSNNNKTEVNVH